MLLHRSAIECRSRNELQRKESDGLWSSRMCRKGVSFCLCEGSSERAVEGDLQAQLCRDYKGSHGALIIPVVQCRGRLHSLRLPD